MSSNNTETPAEASAPEQQTMNPITTFHQENPGTYRQQKFTERFDLDEDEADQEDKTADTPEKSVKTPFSKKVGKVLESLHLKTKK